MLNKQCVLNLQLEVIRQVLLVCKNVAFVMGTMISAKYKSFNHAVPVV